MFFGNTPAKTIDLSNRFIPNVAEYIQRIVEARSPADPVRDLNLKNTNLSDQNFTLILKMIPWLRMIDVSENPEITNQSLNSLKKLPGPIFSLDLSNTGISVDDDLIKYLTKTNSRQNVTMEVCLDGLEVTERQAEILGDQLKTFETTQQSQTPTFSP